MTERKRPGLIAFFGQCFAPMNCCLTDIVYAQRTTGNTVYNTLAPFTSKFKTAKKRNDLALKESKV